ncbi:DegT/DnrJ/EryC1/StrS family aminotransferase [Phycicoccus sp. MAQZ13P-2]|uniref:DegT/DnrJ/EryC1/StrS family aminotransferase n=1 Tax=Phycicoccus mangrovi TaxID=2840470 RepID=UPI001C0042B8|nr:DegT/DnrJ/EryC1/StrS family aminotransferase [Phycicoccus mangrovi]MBT9255916.1 DegT/DnrJ/EryC1/StrS family aminotransferase [Phycicoccus mangrovi]MBT9274510.1 DegT/DnrJ/EryC1/StrS family aminotransferase [Phycicoccus mangrovi]
MTDVVPHARPIIGEAEEAAVLRVLRSGRLAQGEEVEAFETEFSAHFGLDRACVAVSSGTAGLHLSMLALGIGPGDEVVVPSFTFAATANAVALTGATPVFADVDDTFCLDPDAVEAVVGPRTVAVVPVHLYGQPAAMDRLLPLARRHGLAVVEDAAQAHGASLDGVPVGAFGDLGVFSLYPTKNMTAGEGGMVTVAAASHERLLRLLRNQGMLERYRNEVVGLNTRMTDLHAAIGRVQLTRVDAWTRRRQDVARRYDAELRGVTVPVVRPGARHVYHQYTVRVAEDRDGFAAALLREHGISSGVFYPVPVHRLPSFDRVLDLPATERAARECLSLPVHPALSDDVVDRVVEAVARVAGAGS